MTETDPWTARAASSRVSELVDEIEAETAKTIAEVSELDALARAHLGRVMTVADHTAQTLFGVDPHLVNEATWTFTEERLGRIRDALVTIRTDRNLGHVQTMSSEADSLLDRLALISTPPSGRRSRDSAKATQAFFRTLKDLEDRAEVAMVSRIEQVEARRQATLVDMQSSRSDMQAQMSAMTTELDAVRKAVESTKVELDAAVVKFQDDVTKETTTLTGLNRTWNDRFTTTHTEATSEWTKLVKAFTTESNSKREEIESGWRDRLTVLESELGDRLAFFDGQQSRVNQILSVTAAAEAAGSFLNEANDQRHEANFWRWVSLFTWAVAVALGAWSAHDVVANVAGHSTAELTAIAAVRTGFTGLVVTAAVWVARQGGQHRERERMARKLASELTAFRPFVAELGDANVPDALKSELQKASVRFFQGHESSTGGSGRPGV